MGFLLALLQSWHVIFLESYWIIAPATKVIIYNIYIYNNMMYIYILCIISLTWGYKPVITGL